MATRITSKSTSTQTVRQPVVIRKANGSTVYTSRPVKVRTVTVTTRYR